LSIYCHSVVASQPLHDNNNLKFYAVCAYNLNANLSLRRPPMFHVACEERLRVAHVAPATTNASSDL
ncbi:TPA: hypothetical protein ACH988_005726, partial [Escherichia coli]